MNQYVHKSKLRLVVLVYLNVFLWSFLVGYIRKTMREIRVVKQDETLYGRYDAKTGTIR